MRPLFEPVLAFISIMLLSWVSVADTWQFHPEQVSALIQSISTITEPGLYVGLTPDKHDCLVEIYFSPVTMGSENRLSIISHSHHYQRHLGTWFEHSENVVVSSSTEFQLKEVNLDYLHILSRLRSDRDVHMEAKLWLQQRRVIRGEFSGLPFDNSGSLICENMEWVSPASED